MIHLHKSSGLTFECGELMEFPINGVRKTYDMTVITLWRGDDEAPIIIDYYFGEYNEADTNYYIDQWMKRVRACKDIVDAYWLTNNDVLEGEWRDKALAALDAFSRIAEIIK